MLVTGGAGYIGSHACKALHRAGYRVVAFDNLIAGHRAAARFGELVEGDIADTGAVERLGSMAADVARAARDEDGRATGQWRNT